MSHVIFLAGDRFTNDDGAIVAAIASEHRVGKKKVFTVEATGLGTVDVASSDLPAWLRERRWYPEPSEIEVVARWDGTRAVYVLSRPGVEPVTSHDGIRWMDEAGRDPSDESGFYELTIRLIGGPCDGRVVG